MSQVREPNLDAVQLALDRAHRVLWRSQRPDGSWDTPGEVGAWVTGQVVTVLRYLQVLDEADTRGAAQWLTKQQRDDGSFGIHPYSTKGSLSSTACAWAALHACGATQAAEKAKRWVQARGGIEAVINLMNEGDFAAIFLAMAGLVDASRLPCPSTTALLAPPIRHFIETRFHSGVLMGAFQTEFLIRRLRGDFGADGRHKGVLDVLKARAALDIFKTFQNADGSWNDSTVISVLILPALAAIDTPESKSMLSQAVQWVNAQKLRDENGMHFAGFGTEVWATAFDVRALLAGGATGADPDIARAIEWLVNAQLTQPMPKVDNRQPNAPLSGGWAFQRTNHTMPDCDDAGVVLSALGQALRANQLPPALEARVKASTAKGRDWLLGMQNPDGGWSAFVWGLPGKKPGPMMQSNAHIVMSNPLAMVETVLFPPPVTGDPSTEDLTSRVLHGLGQLGDTVHNSAAVARAVAFLKTQQWHNGAWWGRWVVNYLSASSFVLMGLAAVKVDMKEAWVRRAVEFIFSTQNADGGWGEGPESYVDETKAGVGPTMLPLTALVVQALIDAGEGGSDSVSRAVKLLIDKQQPDGTWSNGLYLHTNVPPDTFYVYPEAARFYPTEALGKYLAYRQRRSTALDARTRWSDAQLDPMRLETDPLADDVIARVFARGQTDAVNTLMMSIFRTDQPLPAELPDEVEAYFANTALPAGVTAQELALSEELFTRAGWQVAMGLFCSSLPQAYAAAKGAHVITQTQGMTRHVKQRVFETAQFLFDTMDEGALGPNGRGIRTIQKVRLMHAAIRHLLLTRKSPQWDVATFGKPVNQEDLAGTLMTFSVVTLDALRSLNVPVSDAEAKAWFARWNVVGKLLGIRPELLPTDIDDGEQLMEAIRDRQWRSSPDGRELMKPLIELMQAYFPGVMFDGLPVALVRRLSGDHCADLLGLPQAGFSEALVSAGVFLDGLVLRGDSKEPGDKLMAWATHLFMEGVVLAEREGKNAKFRIPPALTKSIDPRF